MDVDLNCDLGEGAGHDAAVMPLISSANVSCGAHAGSPLEAWRTIRLAQQYGVVVGAHPGHAEREHFGRRELPLSPEQVYVETLHQIGALAALAASEKTVVKYLKPHGGLYHQANREEAYADAVIQAASAFNLMVMGLPDSRLQARSHGRCEFVAEGFADRRYRPDGSLVPRDQPGAFIETPAEAAAQVEWLLRERGVRTICVHGDNPDALIFVKTLRESLLQKGHCLRPFA
jgi:UPF0271 protein